MAINFPNSPVNGSTYNYQDIVYTYLKPDANEGYWAVKTPSTVGVATNTEINEGVDLVKYVTPAALNNSKYVREDEVSGETALHYNGTERVKAKSDGVAVTGKLYLNGQEVVLYPIGSCYLTMSNHNPATLFGGTWALLSGDASLSFGDGTVQTGVAAGSNNPTVPVVYHNHSINHDHPNTTTSTDSHNHYLGAAIRQYPNTFGFGSTTVGPARAEGTSEAASVDTHPYTNTDSHNHTLNVPNYVGSSGTTGTIAATLDVRGSRISVNVWERTA